jgi:hypothetical protein
MTRHNSMTCRPSPPIRRLSRVAKSNDEDANESVSNTDESYVTEENEENGSPEINSVGEWVEARKQWERDNVGNPLEVGVPDQNEWYAYVAVAIGSFILGLYLKQQ